MRKCTRKERVEQRRRLRDIEKEARRVTAELHEEDPALLQERVRELDAQRAAVTLTRFVVWAFDRGPQGRPVVACDTAAEAVAAARAQLRRQAKNVAPAVQLPGGKFLPDWPVYEAHPERLAELDPAPVPRASALRPSTLTPLNMAPGVLLNLVRARQRKEG